LSPLRKNAAGGVGITLTADSSVAIKEVMDVLRNNAVLGLILVVILLYLAIGARNALMVGSAFRLIF
jgi:multidrug efflux pump subunit AcrB